MFVVTNVSLNTASYRKPMNERSATLTPLTDSKSALAPESEYSKNGSCSFQFYLCRRPSTPNGFSVSIQILPTRVLVFEIERVHVEGFMQRRRIFDPHGAAVEVDHHPFGRVESEGICFFDSCHQIPVFRAKKSRASIGAIEMQPESLLPANGTDFHHVIEGAGARRA